MNQIKIGKYIAEKRKAQKLTQAQLAKTLGVGDKSVSKWERGICLPDVSKYIELCNILGITLNELFAGEDLEESKIVSRSEENIISIAKSRKSLKNRMLGIVLGLLVCIAIVSGALVLNLYKNGEFDNNCIYSYASYEPEASKMLSGYGNAHLYTYVIDEQFDIAVFRITKYENGSIVNNNMMKAAELEVDLTQTSKSKEMIGIRSDLDNKRFLVNVSNSDYGSIITYELAVDTEYNKFLEASQVLDIGEHKIDIIPDEEVPLYAYLQLETMYPDLVPEFEEILENPEKALKDVDVCYLFSVTFE